MADATVFEIKLGTIAFKVVDTAAVGYLDTWQAPAGKTVTTAAMADYETGSTTWTCQQTAGALTASQSTTSTDVPATFCGPGRSIPQPAETSYTLDLSFLQDPNISTGFNAYLFANDTKEAYVLFGLADNTGTLPPKMIGRVRLIAGTIGGAARTTLTADVSLPLTRKPSIMFGTGATTVVVNTFQQTEQGEQGEQTDVESESELVDVTS